MSYSLEIKRHSLCHIMTLAVKRLYGSQIVLGVGPAIEEGFYQDFDVALKPEMFPEIEAEMRRIIEAELPFARDEISSEVALKLFIEVKQPLKVELIQNLAEAANGPLNVSLYSVAEHKDLCRGPHVQSAGELRDMAFKLDKT